jgi:hypothetical protein
MLTTSTAILPPAEWDGLTEAKKVEHLYRHAVATERSYAALESQVEALEQRLRQLEQAR